VIAHGGSGLYLGSRQPAKEDASRAAKPDMRDVIRESVQEIDDVVDVVPWN